MNDFFEWRGEDTLRYTQGRHWDTVPPIAQSRREETCLIVAGLLALAALAAYLNRK